MRIGTSGTYSSGKASTSMALSHYTGLPRTRREIPPEAAPGKTLEECTAAELVQLIVIRHVGWPTPLPNAGGERGTRIFLQEVRERYQECCLDSG